jgi:hypothetical protein
MKNIKIGTIFIGSIFLLSGVGVSYAAWFDTLNIHGTVTTGSVSWEIVDYFGTWVYKNLDTEECIESDSPIESQDMVLISVAEATIGEGDYDIKINFENLFPCIWFKAGITVRYTGSIPGKIREIDFISENDWIQNLLSSDNFNIKIKDSLDNTIDEGYQLHFNDEIKIEFWLHIPQQQDLISLSGDFSATLEIMQWNEFINPGNNDGETSLDISNYMIFQTSSDLMYSIPAGLSVEPGGYVIISRDSDKDNFEGFWGVVLPLNVVFINGDNNFPSINGEETFDLQDDSGLIIDGPTGQSMEAYSTVQRLHTTYDPTLLDSWSINPDSYATPGSGAVGDGTAGLVINEYSDASGTGNWRYEFIELYFDI